ncbi:hypothetical protein Taro_023983 [Colocasia esculenta]|uniref:non-specific serine/threonine protein kinase n=1 Tax=Colocasia esculenta TaxID=4460 RepID=A0A843V566_COLES|nr:hypothetical protein [Colocasia esculenta]
MAAPPTSRKEVDCGYDSSCSSSVTLAPASRRRCISDSFSISPSSSSSSSSSSSACCRRTPASYKPHKANQAEWEAIRRLQATAGHVCLEHFCLVRRIGSGDIGTVYLCRLREPGLEWGAAAGCAYAMKVVDREALAIRKKLQRAETERDILAGVDHPFLPTLYASFDAAHYSCLVMEFCPGGDLHALRHRQPGSRFSVPSAKFYAAEVLLALEYLHMMGVVYRDLKPENVLVRADGHIMLSDFDLSFKCGDVLPRLHRHRPATPGLLPSRSVSKGSSTATSCSVKPVLSCFYGTGGSTCTSWMKTSSPPVTDGEDLEHETDVEVVAEPVTARSRSFVGTHEYLAPEVISGGGHGSAVDWWTLGVFLYELLFGRTPFKGDDNDKTLVNILKQPPCLPRMAAYGKQREDMAEALDLIGKLLVKNPKKRIGSSKGSVEIKKHGFFKGVNWALIRSVRPPVVPRDLQRTRAAAKAAASTATAQKVVVKKEGHEACRSALPKHFDYF